MLNMRWLVEECDSEVNHSSSADFAGLVQTQQVTWFGFRLRFYESKHLILPDVFLFIALENSSKPAFYNCRRYC